MRKILRRDLILESCDDPAHQDGCYIRFKKELIYRSEPREDCVIVYDGNGNIIGVEFYEDHHKTLHLLYFHFHHSL